MNKQRVIAIFDIGKTNKKLLLFNEHYDLVLEKSKPFTQINDEDGFECEDVAALTDWILQTTDQLLKSDLYNVKAINFSAYGASFVLLDETMKVFLPLYNYLKPFSAELKENFFQKYGGEKLLTRQTASPSLGNLNSGLQLYRLKYERPEKFSAIKYALHLPQYCAFVLTGKLQSDKTSIGCHTALWDFEKEQYHHWVAQERIDEKFAPCGSAGEPAGFIQNDIPVGSGLHDSSAALVPYLRSFAESFVLISTGTWSISINPFNQQPLTDEELQRDCLCYLSVDGKPVKASRLFAGYEHEEQAKRLAAHFQKSVDFYKEVPFDETIMHHLKDESNTGAATSTSELAFAKRALHDFETYEIAYHQLIADLIAQQVASTELVLLSSTRYIFVDGGFSNNPVYMHLLAKSYPGIKVGAATVPQASALGAALTMHSLWNEEKMPANLIRLRFYPAKDPVV